MRVHVRMSVLVCKMRVSCKCMFELVYACMRDSCASMKHTRACPCACMKHVCACACACMKHVCACACMKHVCACSCACMKLT